MTSTDKKARVRERMARTGENYTTALRAIEAGQDTGLPQAHLLSGTTARIGADDHALFGDPRPELLAEVAGVQPEPGGEWVNLAKHRGFQSTQRLRISDRADGDGVLVATWPAELASQARYLYGRGLGAALVAAAKKHGWTVEPSPHIAFFQAAADQRLYMRLPRGNALEPDKALEYVARWEEEDGLRRVGGNYTREAVEQELWRWLKQQGFTDGSGDAVLQRWLKENLGRRPAHMRPGLRFRRVWTSAEVAGLDSALAETIRSEFDAVFAAAEEPALSSD